MIRFTQTSLTALAALLPLAVLAQDTVPILPDFDLAAFADPAPNPYFPLERGEMRELAAEVGGEDEERSLLTILGPGPLILGVPTVTMLDEAWEGDLLVERTLDYFAADSAGNVWYFGEDVTNFRYDDEDRLVSTDDASAWQAGVNGAEPGIVMPAAPEVGGPVFQEHAPADEAMDFAAVDAIGLTIETPAGSFSEVIQMREGSTSEPDLREYKYYAPGVGMIRADEDLDETFENPALVFEAQP